MFSRHCGLRRHCFAAASRRASACRRFGEGAIGQPVAARRGETKGRPPYHRRTSQMTGPWEAPRSGRASHPQDAAPLRRAAWRRCEQIRHQAKDQISTAARPRHRRGRRRSRHSWCPRRSAAERLATVLVHPPNRAAPPRAARTPNCAPGQGPFPSPPLPVNIPPNVDAQHRHRSTSLTVIGKSAKRFSDFLDPRERAAGCDDGLQTISFTLFISKHVRDAG